MSLHNWNRIVVVAHLNLDLSVILGYIVMMKSFHARPIDAVHLAIIVIMLVIYAILCRSKIIPLSHYSENEIRTYYEHEMLKFVVKSVGNFSFSQI